MKAMQWFTEHYQDFLTILAFITAVASLICALIPKPNADSVFGKLFRVLELLALNVGRAKK
jgi:hypothetical protein